MIVCASLVALSLAPIPKVVERPAPVQASSTSHPPRYRHRESWPRYPATTTVEIPEEIVRENAPTVTYKEPGASSTTDSSNPSADGWEALRRCESDGNYADADSATYRGAYQFDHETWTSVGGTGDPADASVAEQDARALDLYAQRGSAPWPHCGRHL